MERFGPGLSQGKCRNSCYEQNSHHYSEVDTISESYSYPEFSPNWLRIDIDEDKKYSFYLQIFIFNVESMKCVKA